jgi:hypothetical protein
MERFANQSQKTWNALRIDRRRHGMLRESIAQDMERFRTDYRRHGMLCESVAEDMERFANRSQKTWNASRIDRRRHGTLCDSRHGTFRSRHGHRLLEMHSVPLQQNLLQKQGSDDSCFMNSRPCDRCLLDCGSEGCGDGEGAPGVAEEPRGEERDGHVHRIGRGASKKKPF